jgi:hypothetical protein
MMSIINNYRLIFLVALLGLIYPYKNFAQTETAKNSIYLELLGNGGLYSINYDRMFSENVGARVGLSYLSEFDIIFAKIEDLFIAPVTINYLVGERNSKLELGAGIVFISVKNSDIFGFTKAEHNSAIRGTATFGYRYQPKDGGFVFRAGFTPVFGSQGFYPSGGISFGFCF